MSKVLLIDFRSNNFKSHYLGFTKWFCSQNILSRNLSLPHREAQNPKHDGLIFDSEKSTIKNRHHHKHRVVLRNHMLLKEGPNHVNGEMKYLNNDGHQFDVPKWNPFLISFNEASTMLRASQKIKPPNGKDLLKKEGINRIFTFDGNVISITKLQYHKLVNIVDNRQPNGMLELDPFDDIMAWLGVWINFDGRDKSNNMDDEQSSMVQQSILKTPVNLMKATRRLVTSYAPKRGPLRMAILLCFKAIYDERFQQLNHENSKQHNEEKISETSVVESSSKQLSLDEAVLYLNSMSQISAIHPELLNHCINKILFQILNIVPNSWMNQTSFFDLKQIAIVTSATMRLRLDSKKIDQIFNHVILNLMLLDNTKKSDMKKSHDEINSINDVTNFDLLLHKESYNIIHILWSVILRYFPHRSTCHDQIVHLLMKVMTFKKTSLLKEAGRSISFDTFDFSSWNESYIERPNNYTKNKTGSAEFLKQREIQIMYHSFNRLKQILATLEVLSPEVVSEMDHEIKDSLRAIAELSVSNTTMTDSHRSIAKVLSEGLHLPVQKEFAVTNQARTIQLMVDIVIQELDETRKNQVIQSVIGDRFKDLRLRNEALNQFIIEDLKIPFKTQYNKIAIEIDGSYHYINNLSFISSNSKVSDDKFHDIDESLRLEFPKNMIQSSPMSSLPAWLMNSLGQRESYLNGSSYFKQQLLKSYGWIPIRIPVFRYTSWSYRGNVLNSLRKELPIDWPQWDKQIETIKVLAQEETKQQFS